MSKFRAAAAPLQVLLFEACILSTVTRPMPFLWTEGCEQNVLLSLCLYVIIFKSWPWGHLHLTYMERKPWPDLQMVTLLNWSVGCPRNFVCFLQLVKNVTLKFVASKISRFLWSRVNLKDVESLCLHRGRLKTAYSCLIQILQPGVSGRALTTSDYSDEKAGVESMSHQWRHHIDWLILCSFC